MKRLGLLLVVLLVGCDGGGSTTTVAPSSTTTTLVSTTTTTVPLVPSEMVEGGFEVFVVGDGYGHLYEEPVPIVRDRDVVSVNWDYQIYVVSFEDVAERISDEYGDSENAVVLFDGEVLFEFTLYPGDRVWSGIPPAGVTGPFGFNPIRRGFWFALCDGYCDHIWGGEGLVTSAIDYPFMDLLGDVRDHFELTGRLVDMDPVGGWAYRVSGDRIWVSVGCRVEADEIRLLAFEDGYPKLWEFPAESVRWRLVAEDGPVGLSVVELGAVPAGFVETVPYLGPEDWFVEEGYPAWASLVFFQDGEEVAFAFVDAEASDAEPGWATPMSGTKDWDDYQDWLAEYPALIGGNCSVREPDPLG